MKLAAFVVMAWSPLALRKARLEATRRLVARTSVLLGDSAAFIEQVRARGALPSALLLALRAANKLAQTLIEQPMASPTPEQRRTLLAAGAQIRALAAGILASGGASDPNSVEFELAALILRTLALIDHVTAEPLTIDTTVVADEARLEKPRD